MAHALKPGQLCTIDGEVYRCSKRTTAPCLECHYYYGGSWYSTPCEKWALCDSIPTCATLFGDGICEEASFPILVSMCKK